MDLDLDLETAVRSVGKIPELLIPQGVCFEPAANQMINAYKYFYRGKQEWLNNLVLHKPLSSEAVFTDWKHFQGAAVLDSALLTLISGLHPRSLLLQESVPIIIWFMALAINCEKVLADSGILGKPSLVGKVEYLTHKLGLSSQQI